jgi:hypothetical protein
MASSAIAWPKTPHPGGQREQVVCALRFFYREVLKTGWEVRHIPYQKTGRTLPEILSPEEVRPCCRPPATSSTHEYRIVVEGDRALPTLTVRVETQWELAPSERLALKGRVAEALGAAIRVRPRLELCPPGTLPRAEAGGKMRRVLDRRTGW